MSLLSCYCCIVFTTVSHYEHNMYYFPTVRETPYSSSKYTLFKCIQSLVQYAHIQLQLHNPMSQSPIQNSSI